MSLQALRYCCGEIYSELQRLNKGPAREALVRHQACIDQLVESIRQVWIVECGGDPERWPWNQGFVLDTYIQFRKDTRIKKDTGELDRPKLTFCRPKGVVYFIQNSRFHIKIGWTEGDPSVRLKALQTGESEELKLLGWLDGTQTTEQSLHARFAEYRIRRDGEWFHPCPDLLNLIKENRPFQS